MIIRGKAILLLALSLCLQSEAKAQEKAGLEDKVIGSTFKALAKTFVMASDIRKIKKDNVNKLKKMDDEKFKKRFALVYEVIKDLPPDLKASFRITERMTKEQVIRDMESLDKKKLYTAVDAIPDTFIANRFKRYLNEKKQTLQKSNIVEQINKLWNKILQKSKISA